MTSDEMDKKALFAAIMELHSQSVILLEMAQRVMDLEKVVAKLMEARDAS